MNTRISPLLARPTCLAAACLAAWVATPAAAVERVMPVGINTPALLKVSDRLGEATPAAADTTALAAAAAEPSPENLEQMYFAGRYADVGTQGLAWLSEQKAQQADPALRLKIANSLAWSNRLETAIAQYEDLVRNTDQATLARVPLANAYRWSGRADLSLPHYERAVQDDTQSTEAADGLEYAQRELRPRTTVQFAQSQDSGDLGIRSGSVTHRWRDASLQQIYEVEGDIRNDQQDPTGPNPRHRGATLRYENVGLAWKPLVTVDLQTHPRSGLYGGLKVKMGALPIHVDVARENFGVTAASARALNAGLTANRIGVEGNWSSSVAVLSGRLNFYDISDQNKLRTASVKLAPTWRPLGAAFKPYVGIDTRDVKFNSPNYWSPLAGSGSFGLGATAEWAEKDWFFFLAGQVGTRIYGEAGNSKSASVGGQRWLDKDTAVTVNLWGMSSVRDQARYRAHSLNVKLDRLW
jgi:tetratricopeptide (TPR) repeat protein